MEQEKHTKLLNLINTVLKGIGVEAILNLDDQLNLRNDLEIDSISYAELVVILEEEFNVNINDPNKAQTIGDIKSRLMK